MPAYCASVGERSTPVSPGRLKASSRKWPRPAGTGRTPLRRRRARRSRHPTDGRELLLTRYTEPEPELALLLDKLKFVLPAQPEPKISAAQIAPSSPA